MDRPMTRRRATAGLAGFAATTFIPAVARAEDDTLQSIYEGAKKEGKVVFWSSNDVAASQASARRFAQKFPGIEVEAYKIEPGPAIERIIGETSAGRLSADVTDSPISYTQLLFDRGLALQYPWKKVFGIDDETVLFDGRALYCYNLDVPIAFNTQLAKAADIKSWDDLLDPKWRGKILLEGRGIVFPLLALAWGEDKAYAFLDKLLANKPIIIKGGTPTIEALAGGQGAIAVGTYGGRVLQFQAEGAPVDWARVGPIPAMIYVQMALKGAPHPNASKLWTWWTTTKEHQEELYKHHRFGRLTGPNMSPLGKMMADAHLQVVIESQDSAEMQRLLVKAGAAISGRK
jgi:iron(III) transport system substrate-binding protein